MCSCGKAMRFTGTLITLVVCCCFNVSLQNRTKLLDLVRGMATTLEAGMKQTNDYVKNITEKQDNFSLALGMLETQLLGISVTFNDKFEKLEEFESVVRQDLRGREKDRTMWTFNALVCNATIEELREEMETKFEELKTRRVQETTTEKNSESDIKESNPLEMGTNFLDDLRKFEATLQDDYDYYGETSVLKNTSSFQPTTGKTKTSVDSLIEVSNKLLDESRKDFDYLDRKVSELEKSAKALTKKVDSTEDIDELRSTISKVEERLSFQVMSLEGDVLRGDESLRNEMKMKMEDVSIVKEMTKSRHSVYDTRLDILEQLVFNISAQLDQSLLLGGKEVEPTSEAPVINQATTNSDWEMMDSGLDRIKSIFGTDFSGDNGPDAYDDNNMGIPSYHDMDPLGLFPIGRNPDPALGRSQQDPVRDFRSVLPPAKIPIDDCNCAEMKARFEKLEKNFDSLMQEVESQMSGMQASITTILHRMQAGPDLTVNNGHLANMAQDGGWQAAGQDLAGGQFSRRQDFVGGQGGNRMDLVNRQPDTAGDRAPMTNRQTVSQGYTRTCFPTKTVSRLPGMETWCQETCARSHYCNSELCVCR